VAELSHARSIAEQVFGVDRILAERRH
jgi:hypothetical protein